MPRPWAFVSQQIWIRSFKWSTVELLITIYSKVMGCQTLQSKIIRIAWSLSAKIGMLMWGPGSILGLGKFGRLVTLQSFDLHGSIVLHLKDLIHICLELELKAVLWLLTGFMLGQSTLISYHTETNGCIFFAADVCWYSTQIGHLLCGLNQFNP